MTAIGTGPIGALSPDAEDCFLMRGPFRRRDRGHRPTRRFQLPSIHSEERGTVIIIVVLSIFAIFGMLVLTVDVGGLLYKRVQLMEGADAGALAAALSCGNSLDTTDPGTMADQYAMSNVDGLGVDNGGIIDQQGCDTGGRGYVTVEYTQQQSLFFGPVLGFSNSQQVYGRATAAWGPLGGGAGNMLPVMLQQGQLQGTCGVPGTTPGTVCGFWYNNNDLGNAQFGFLNLDFWNIDAGSNLCPNAGATQQTRGGWILNGYPTMLMLNGNPPGTSPTYVCADTGHASVNWQELKDEENTTRLFPVNDCNGQVDSSGVPAPCPLTPNKYDIVGFAELYLLHVYHGDDPLAVGSQLSDTCQVNYDWGANGVLNLSTVVYPTFPGTNQNCPPSAAPTIPYATLTISRGSTTFVKCLPPGGAGCDYTYDEVTHTIVWGSRAANNTKIVFNWSFPPSLGACGYHPRDSNAICIQVRYDGYSTDVGPISDGPSFGAVGVRLCDLTIQNSCPKTS